MSADQATEFPKELTDYGLTEESLLTALQKVCGGVPIDLELTQTLTVGFYRSLHNRPFTRFTNKTLIGKFYLEIDPFLRAKGSRADNVYRFIENLSTTQHLPSDQPVNYKIEQAQKREIKTMKAELEHCHEVVGEVVSEYGQLKGKFQQIKMHRKGP